MTATAHSMFERRLHALVAGLALVGLGAVMTILVLLDRRGSVLQPIDDHWLRWMTDVRAPWLTSAAKAMSVLGGPFVMVPLRLVVIGALAWRRRWLQLAAFLGATVTSELCIGPLKSLVDRPRPPGSLIETSSSSFPSGHAIAASVTAIGLVVVLVPAASRRMRWTIVAASFAALMAMSRTYLGAHWASDVIGGACLGTGLAVVWPAALEIERARRTAKRERKRDAPRLAPTAPLRAVSMALLIAGFACVVVLHVVRRDLDPADHRLSEYAIGRFGSVMTVAFISIGLGLLTLGWALSRTGTPSGWSRPVPAAVGVAGAGMVVSGLYRTDPNRSGAAADSIHSVASAVATLTLIAAAVAWSVVRHGTLRAPRPDLSTGLAGAAVVLGALSPFLHRSALTGVSQRLLWLSLLAWSAVTVWQTGPRQQVGAHAPHAVADMAPVPTSAARQRSPSP